MRTNFKNFSSYMRNRTGIGTQNRRWISRSRRKMNPSATRRVRKLRETVRK